MRDTIRHRPLAFVDFLLRSILFRRFRLLFLGLGLFLLRRISRLLLCRLLRLSLGRRLLCRRALLLLLRRLLLSRFFSRLLFFFLLYRFLRLHRRIVRISIIIFGNDRRWRRRRFLLLLRGFSLRVGLLLILRRLLLILLLLGLILSGFCLILRRLLLILFLLWSYPSTVQFDSAQVLPDAPPSSTPSLQN